MRYAKAAVGALIAGLGTLATALSDGHVQQVEWVWIAIAFLTALGGIWAVPNATPQQQAEHRLVAADEKLGQGGYPGGNLGQQTFTRTTGTVRLGGDTAPPD